MEEILRFSKEFIRHPVMVSSLVPSSKSLSKEMVRIASIRANSVIFEFGCGTGAVTGEIVKNLPKDSKLVAFDVNPTFTKMVKDKYPHVEVVNDSVENVEKYMRRKGIKGVDVVISSLPWTVFSSKSQVRLMKTIHRILNSGGKFLTYYYLHTSVLPSQKRFRKLLMKKFVESISVSGVVWRNIPPAVVIKCTK